MSSITHYVNVSCANLYRQPSYHSEIDSQVTLWEPLQFLEQHDDFIKIIAEDGYEGWVSRYQLSEYHDADREHFRRVTVLSIKIYSQPDTQSVICGEAVAGSRLPVITSQSGWSNVLLPDGVKGWIEERAFSKMPAFTPDNIIDFSKRFLGIPYFWGGKTPKGVDCSGFVQLVFKLFGVPIRRDAWMQHEDGKPVTDDPIRAKRGELLFFAESGEKITHIALSMGEGMMIHARGRVKINSMIESHNLFDLSLKQSFVDVKSYL